MEALRRTFRLIRVNWRTLVCFELFYKAAVAVGFTLLVSLGFRLVMRVMGLSYLTREGIGGIAAELVDPVVRTVPNEVALCAAGEEELVLGFFVNKPWKTVKNCDMLVLCTFIKERKHLLQISLMAPFCM